MRKRPHVLLGVSGGIAAYKSAEVVRRLVDAGAEVRVAMTRAAREFIAPLTFAVLSKHEVYVELFGNNSVAGLIPKGSDPQQSIPAVDHVELAEWTDVLVVAPATAHTIARLANGLADDFLTTYFLVHRGPVLVAPAMETRMWEHPATRRNLELLSARGARFVGPGAGFLASGREGAGRMAEPEEITQEAITLATASRDLEGLRVLVTAGPTRERVDPIRFVSNRSSGRMGYALAESARDRGARVTLLSGPTGLTRPEGMRFVSFESAAELENLLAAEFPECDVLAMAAAVADFIPEESPERLHRERGEQTVRLVPGRDLLAGLGELRGKQTVVAFAAETEELETRGRRKMETKGADLIAVNDIGRADVGFDATDNEVLLLARDGGAETVSRRSKREVADRIWDEVRRVRSSQVPALSSQPEPRS